MPFIRLPAIAVASLFISTFASADPRPATAATRDANEAVKQQLDFTDTRAFEDAQRGFIAALPKAEVIDEQGQTVWSNARYAFLDSEQAPASVNPSLWRQARLNAIHGLFEVTEGIYQVRGMDLANMTIVEGKTGLIVIDPLLTPATAKAALDLYRTHRPARPVVAVIYTHSHVDHFGGVKGVASQADVDAGRVKIYAPNGFMEHAVSENVIAGNAMTRRAKYMYGTDLPVGPQGHVDTGLGKGLSRGPMTLIAPTDIVRESGVQRIDGVDIDFRLAPGSEAPAEMMMYFPAARVLNTAELTSQQLHNVYTLRGAEVRDASLWSRYIDEALDQYGPISDVIIAQHHWPVWGKEQGRHFLAVQRDLYKFIHDQSVRLMNHGYRPGDIAETLKLPASLATEWAARDYYGTLRHNARGVFQKYLGWYDANPANLNPPAPQDAARKTIEYMGGIDNVIKQARNDYAAGNYRWVATVMSQAVFADPSKREARELAADALEQLGYQAESGPWRDVYLSGAQDLRGTAPTTATEPGLHKDLLQALDTGMFFDLLGVRLNGTKAEGRHLVLNWIFTDTNERFRVNLENAALTWLPNAQADAADATVTLTRATLNDILQRQNSFPKALKTGEIDVSGNPKKLLELLSLMDDFKPDFPLIEPR
ncbi:MBL fold metallo-hydrolase [Pseudomonas stutzeri]|uniref:alkyl/aryl-sulfatase n=1 Tax=Stutzerimonas stutzeri TaxID=316 RepID=UPI00210C748E|nr:alkyl sulfatase dimerization domain-containing protein [Stutzerimonas stutzeri]MCQ4310305.1 MBL fold metallo-hydrolase [Stutzerimonas stutzeri]